ncbi:MAG TPA: dynamin family protein [Actinophytocola sp.]|uniref:dynamin family protein n=1 Tax=Actinophytocola sp. TaxID=1872138 RepID=UPI002DB580A1|nr:dynamin family protein [Actinophytocola sp.]HEU5469340.1 dynamin family protein [Actinophytocola sp.]
MTENLSDAVRKVLRLAVYTYRDQPRTVELLRRQLERLDEPLRVAIAGKVKAGKSTLLNALVGEAVAPTDAGECTRVVTWYRDGASPRITLYPKDGAPSPLPVVRRDGALTIDLGGTAAERVDRLVVDWPAQSLRGTTLIDTPGIASLSTDVARRTLRFLDPEDETPTEADAVLYLMRHLHVTDTEFLESFRDQGVARATAVNAVAVISRADEIGGGRVDAMLSARAIATRYRSEPALAGLCQNVVAVAGLLAHTGRTLRQAEFTALAALADAPRDELDAALLSADRFLAGDETRRALVHRFGLFGIRLATMLIRQGVRSPATLSTELVGRSGLADLQRVLHVQFAERRDLLKARSALLAMDRLLRAGGDDGRGLAAAVERILAGAHEFAELRLLGALRSGAVRLPQPLSTEAERLLGDSGAAPAVRLGLPAEAGPDDLRRTALSTLDRWRRHAENPMLSRRAADACRVLVRTCEGILSRSARPPSARRLAR